MATPWEAGYTTDTSVERGQQPTVESFMYPKPSVSRKKYHRRRTGCLTCRQRKKRCDEQYDELTRQCKACSRMGLSCTLAVRSEAPHIVENDTNCSGIQSPQTPDLGFGDRSGLLKVNDDFPAREVVASIKPIEHVKMVLLACLSSTNLSSVSELALRYYIDQLIPCRATYRDGETGFHMLVSRAITQPSMMEALLALSFAHQVETSSTSTQQALCQRALDQYTRAIQAFRNILTSESTNLETSATIAILLIATETINGGTTDWVPHSDGATTILNMGRGQFDPSLNIYHRFLTRSMIYIDVLGAVVLGIEPRLDQQFYTQERNNSVTENVHSMLAANTLLLTILADVCRLRFKIKLDGQNGLKELNQIEPDFDTLYQSVSDLEGELQAIAPSNSQRILMGLLFEAYRHASILFLYQILQHVDRHSLDISLFTSRRRLHLQSLTQYLSRIPANSAPASGLLFPLFIGGVSASTETERAIILSKLSQLHAVRRFGNIALVSSTLQKIWAAPGVRCGTLDWQYWIKTSGKFVALF